MALEEHLLSFELSEGDTRSGGACCTMQALSHGAAPGSHCGSVDVSGHRQHCSGHLPSGVWCCGGLTAPPPSTPASAAACAGRRSTANRCLVEPPAATAAGSVSGGVSRGCRLTDSSAPWWFSHPVTRPHVTPLLVAS